MRTDFTKMALLLGIALIAAFSFSLYTAWQWGPTGALLLRDALIKPDELFALDFNATNPLTREPDRYIFDKVILATRDSLSKSWEETEIDRGRYRFIYQTLSSDRSIVNPSISLESGYESGYLHAQEAKLILYVKTESSELWQRDVMKFQEVQFLSTDYRVQIRLDKLSSASDASTWIYFHHPEIIQTLLHP